jgi:hypothetical protein
MSGTAGIPVVHDGEDVKNGAIPWRSARARADGGQYLERDRPAGPRRWPAERPWIARNPMAPSGSL